MSECKTPGCVYHTRITSVCISVVVSLPDGVLLQNLNAHMLPYGGSSTMKTYEEILHDAVEGAIAEILQMNEQNKKDFDHLGRKI